MSYNGWSNYETWNVALWLSNDEGSYTHWRREASDAWDDSEGEDDRTDAAAADLARRLEREIKDGAPELDGTYSDLLSAALGAVDWHEIAAGMIEDGDFQDDSEDEDEANDEGTV
ncbi:MAG TPA: hypothetical protein VH439_03965 [Gemmatimonadales bacterium]